MPFGEILMREIVIDKVVVNSVDNNIVPIKKLMPNRSTEANRQANTNTLADLLALLANELNHLTTILERERKKL